MVAARYHMGKIEVVGCEAQLYDSVRVENAKRVKVSSNSGHFHVTAEFCRVGFTSLSLLGLLHCLPSQTFYPNCRDTLDQWLFS